MRSVVIAINNHCMLKCLHCYNNAIHPQNKVADYFSVSFFEDLQSIGVKQVALSGGEPLLNWELLVQISKIINKKIGTIITTNGLLLSEDKIATLQDLGVSIIQVSLDGSTALIHEKLRGPNTFTPVFEKLCKYSDIIVPIFTIHALNYFDVGPFLKLLIENGIKQVGFERYIPINQNTKNICLNLKREQLEIAYLEILKYESEIKIHINDPLYNVFKAQYYDLPPVIFDCFETTGCQALNCNIYIDVDGNVYPCTFSDKPLFNVHKKRIGLDLISCFIKKYNKNKIVVCESCQYKKICNGCRAAAYCETNNWFGEDPLCLKK